MDMSQVKRNGMRVQEEGWRFDCDHTGCYRHITIHADGHVFDSAADEQDHLVRGVEDAVSAFALGAIHHGWTRSTQLPIRFYCPEHSKEARP